MDDQKPRVLIVEDETGPSQSLRAILNPTHEVFLAKSGHEALKILLDEEMDAVTLDLRLPDLTGEEILSWIKKNKQSTEVIIVTGHGGINSAADAVKYGAFSYLLKPFDTKAVLDSVSGAVTKKKQKDRIEGLMSEISNALDYPIKDENGTESFERKEILLDKIKQTVTSNRFQLILEKGGVHREFLRNLAEAFEETDP